MMGSTHTYDIKGGARPPPGGQARGAETPIEMALNPEEIDLMDSDAMALKAEAVLRLENYLSHFLLCAFLILKKQCFGSGSVWIRFILVIRIQVAKNSQNHGKFPQKINQNH